MAAIPWQLILGGAGVYLIISYMNKWPPFNKGGIGEGLLNKITSQQDPEIDLSQPPVATPPAINPFESTVQPGSFELGMGAQMPFPGPAGNSPATPGQFQASTPQNDPTNVQYGIYTQYLNGLRSEQQRARDELNKLNEGNVGIGGDITTLPQPPVTPGLSGMGIPPMYGGPVISPIPGGQYGSPGMGYVPPQSPMMFGPPPPPPMFPYGPRPFPFPPMPMGRGNVSLLPVKEAYTPGNRVTVVWSDYIPNESVVIQIMSIQGQPLLNQVVRSNRDGGGTQGITIPNGLGPAILTVTGAQSRNTGYKQIQLVGSVPTSSSGGFLSGMFGGINDLIRNKLMQHGLYSSNYADTTFTEYEEIVVPQDLNALNPTFMGMVSRNQPMGIMSNKLGNIR